MWPQSVAPGNDRGLDRIFHVNRCADFCSAIVETVATTDHINKAIFTFALILFLQIRIESRMHMKRMPKPTTLCDRPVRLLRFYPIQIPNSYDLDFPMISCAG